MGAARRPTGVARSMTSARSIGARSDWGSQNGDKANGDTDADDETLSNGKASNGPSRTWSIYKEDGDPSVGKPRPEDDPDDPINKYVQDQLERIKSNESHEYAEELAAQNDGADDDIA